MQNFTPTMQHMTVMVTINQWTKALAVMIQQNEIQVQDCDKHMHGSKKDLAESKVETDNNFPIT